jgi:hypothetical protein
MRWLGALLSLTGCVTTYGPQTITPAPDRESARAAWQKVLEKHVDAQGRVQFDAAGKDPNLQAYVAYIARENPLTQPDKFPDRSEALAEYLNSYNALALYGVVQSGERKGFLNGLSRAKFFAFTKYVVGGKEISLYDYENKTIRKLGEPRVHMALNCMSVGCPRLPREAFVGATLEQQLQDAAVEFFNSSKHVQVDTGNKIARLSEILDFFTEDFVREGESLLVYVNRYRKEKIPTDYKVEFIPYDWALNWQPQ